MAFFGIAAVTLCVGMLIVITSLFNGFINAYLDHVRRLLGDVVLQPGVEITDHEVLARYLEEQDTIETARPKIQAGALLYIRPRVVKAVELMGIDLERQCRDEVFRRGLLRQGDGVEEPDFGLSQAAQIKARAWLEKKLHRQVTDEELPVGAIVGIGVLAEPDEQTDEYDRQGIIRENLLEREGAMIITTGGRSGEGAGEGDMPVRKISEQCWPVDVIQTGMYDVDTRIVYLPFAFMREMTGTRQEDGKVKCSASFHITARAGADLEQVITQANVAWKRFFREKLSGLDIQSDFALIYISLDEPGVRKYTRAIRLQLVIMQLIMGLICLVAALLIFVILFMAVMQKRRDIGIIRSLGSSGAQVAQIFLLYGGGIGAAGALLGLVLGVWATKNINIIEHLLATVLGFKIWRSGVYIFSEIPDNVAWGSVGWIMVAGIGAALLGALLPARHAARMLPAEALRWE